MNDYMDYYNYINNLNLMPNSNQTTGFSQVKKSSSKAGKQQSLAEPYTGFVRGNMFNNLYNEYKNYSPKELNPMNDKEYLQMLIQMYGFAAHDLSLYLDVNPNDTNVIKQRAEYVKMYNEALVQYENNYGPITKNSVMLDATPWGWDNTNFPWEGLR